MTTAKTAAEEVEIALISLVGVAVWLMAERLPNYMGIGSLLLGSSVLLLFQGLIRDLGLIPKRNRQAKRAPRHQALCMCVESTAGVTGIVAGLIIFGSAIDLPLSMSPWICSALATAILVIGFAIKDFVLEWRPFRIRHDKDHVNLVLNRPGFTRHI